MDSSEHTESFEPDYSDLSPGVSSQEAKTGVRRLLQIVAGVLITAAGVAMLFVPGPGLVAILVGLNMVKPDNAIVRWMRRKVPGIPEDGAIPKKYLVLGAVFLAGTTAISIIWGDDFIAWVRRLIETT